MYAHTPSIGAAPLRQTVFENPRPGWTPATRGRIPHGRPRTAPRSYSVHPLSGPTLKTLMAGWHHTRERPTAPMASGKRSSVLPTDDPGRPGGVHGGASGCLRRVAGKTKPAGRATTRSAGCCGRSPTTPAPALPAANDLGGDAMMESRTVHERTPSGGLTSGNAPFCRARSPRPERGPPLAGSGGITHQVGACG